MRDYAKLAPTFWTGTTGKELRRRGSEALLVGLYLVSSPSSNMLGLYYQPLLYMAHETGLGIEGASKGLAQCIEAGFCSYDPTTEIVFVHEMAAWQIGPSLKALDKRCLGVQKDYDALPDNPFLEAFFVRYSAPFHLKVGRQNLRLQPVFFEAPSKPLPSQEQEQEQEQREKRYTPPPPKTGNSKKSGNGSDPDLTASDLIAEGVDAKHARDWLRIRRAKKAPLTGTAWEGIKREGKLAGLSPARAVQHAAEAGWQGFKADWLTRPEHAGNGRAAPNATTPTPVTHEFPADKRMTPEESERAKVAGKAALERMNKAIGREK